MKDLPLRRIRLNYQILGQPRGSFVVAKAADFDFAGLVDRGLVPQCFASPNRFENFLVANSEGNRRSLR